MMTKTLLAFVAAGAAMAAQSPLEMARDQQDRAALQKLVNEAADAAAKAPNDADAQYRMAVASSYLAEVALEVKDKKQAEEVAERGVKAAERAVSLKPDSRSYVVLGTLCGQVVPANVLTGMGYAKRAQDAIEKAIQKDPKSSKAYEARGVGNYYLPKAFGGGYDLAIADFRKAIELDPKNAEAYLWLGLSLRKQNKDGEARRAFEQSLQLDPNRVWTKQQLDKTPAK
ncbi:MAG TPA: tetratricopeptide repeat protein [Candidatus Limnocylindrales bacterium]|nr:tetratricopeptide repeat protein [Candidatus Limnocylindrales bacterium]